MRSYLILIALVPILCACGGGGVGSDSDPFVGYVSSGDPISPPDDGAIDDGLDADKVAETLAQCVVPDVQEILDLLDLAKNLVDDAELPSGVEVTNVDLLQVTAAVSIDLDLDGTPEAFGTIQCLDADGDPKLPVPLLDLLDLMNGSGDALQILNQIEDGTRILVDFTYREIATIQCEFEIVFEGGWPSEGSGQVEVVKEPCGGTLSFEHVGYEIWDGAYPICEIDLAFETDEGSLVGTLTADGTSIAMLAFTLDGDSWTFELDLTTGELTPIV